MIWMKKTSVTLPGMTALMIEQGAETEQAPCFEATSDVSKRFEVS